MNDLWVSWETFVTQRDKMWCDKEIQHFKKRIFIYSASLQRPSFKKKEIEYRVCWNNYRIIFYFRINTYSWVIWEFYFNRKYWFLKLLEFENDASITIFINASINILIFEIINNPKRILLKVTWQESSNCYKYTNMPFDVLWCYKIWY